MNYTQTVILLTLNLISFVAFTMGTAASLVHRDRKMTVFGVLGIIVTAFLIWILSGRLP
jgi:hypothetical protein